MTKPEIDYRALSLSPLFVDWNQDELETLVEASEIHSVCDGATVVTEGEPGESMYLLHDGEVTIEKRTDF